MLGLALVVSPSMALPAQAVAPSDTADSSAQQSGEILAPALQEQARGDLKKFYAARNFQPIWIEKGKVGRSARQLLKYIDEADFDGLKPSRYSPDKLRKAIHAADSGTPSDLAAAEIALSQSFARLVADMRKVKNVGIKYADKSLRPGRVSTLTALRAATIRSFGAYLESMGWMNPHYVEMRRLLIAARTEGQPKMMTDIIRLNLERARHLPSPGVRHIVVDVASGRLWYYQTGKEAGTMKVVVGTHTTPTPLMVGKLTWAIVNPYWNVPDYLVRDNVARKVLSGRTLKSMNMQALSNWSETAQAIDPGTVDWQAVADGKLDLRVRELPGPANSMGKVKFLFPNDEGIYLHDTPATDLFKLNDRHKSNGCIRLENAAVLGRWMMGDALNLKAKETEKAIAIPAAVPVYLTYLTPIATKQGVGLRKDVYGLDKSAT